MSYAGVAVLILSCSADINWPLQLIHRQTQLTSTQHDEGLAGDEWRARESGRKREDQRS